VLGVLACHGIDRLLAGHQHAQALPPDQGTDPASLDPVAQVLPPWYRDGRGVLAGVGGAPRPGPVRAGRGRAAYHLPHRDGGSARRPPPGGPRRRHGRLAS
jgi:hypothetical protein